MLSLNFSIPNMSVIISVRSRGEGKKDDKIRNKQDSNNKSAAGIDLVAAALDSPGIAF